ncbi:MAG TPA: hypothetical protein DCK95_04625 [Anaerolineaceae bacterium]|nr:hypothetical protein [Anaerolineaceae bacterium]
MIQLISDTLSCIPLDEANNMGLLYLPQIIVFGDKTYRDDSEIDSITFGEKLSVAKQLPTTAAPPPAIVEPIFKQIEEKGDTAIAICPSEKISGTYRAYCTAKQEHPAADIRIIDVKTLGTAQGILVRIAKKMLDDGASANEIESTLQELSAKTRTYFLVDTLEYLYKGGRIGAASKLVGSMLQMKPILQIVDGQIDAKETQRTTKKAIERFKEIILDECPASDTSYLNIEHGGIVGKAQEFASTLKEESGVSTIPVNYLPPAIILHGGPTILGCSFLVK